MSRFLEAYDARLTESLRRPDRYWNRVDQLVREIAEHTGRTRRDVTGEAYDRAMKGGSLLRHLKAMNSEVDRAAAQTSLKWAELAPV